MTKFWGIVKVYMLLYMSRYIKLSIVHQDNNSGVRPAGRNILEIPTSKLELNL